MKMEWRFGSLMQLLGWVAGLAVVFGYLAFSLSSTNPSAPKGASQVGAASETLSTVGGPVFSFRIARTGGGGLNIRNCAAVTCAKVGSVAEGATFTAVCSTSGGGVAGETVWLKGSAGSQSGFVARSYLDATGGAQAANAVPPCDGSSPTHPVPKG